MTCPLRLELGWDLLDPVSRLLIGADSCKLCSQSGSPRIEPLAFHEFAHTGKFCPHRWPLIAHVLKNLLKLRELTLITVKLQVGLV